MRTIYEQSTSKQEINFIHNRQCLCLKTMTSDTSFSIVKQRKIYEIIYTITEMNCT